jgi:hypothetical protein
MNGVIIMLTEIEKAVKQFDTLTEEELGYWEGEILGFAFYADGEINIDNNYYSESPYVRIGNQHYNSDPRIKANYRSGLAKAIRKGFVEQWCENTFLLTKKGWDKAEAIVEDIKKNHINSKIKKQNGVSV